jgi:hypothetical protein
VSALLANTSETNPHIPFIIVTSDGNTVMYLTGRLRTRPKSFFLER